MSARDVATRLAVCSLLNVPSAHGIGATDAAGQNLPGGHVAHSVLPWLFWKVPGSHGEQTLEPVSLANEPEAQSVGAVEPNVQ